MTEQAPLNTEITQDDKLWAALSYAIPVIIPIIILLMEDKKNRPFLKAHAVQALILGILVYVFSAILCGVVLWFVMLFWAYKAYQGEYVNVPVITDLVKKQNWA